MKWRNGKPYRKFRTSMGRVLWVEMHEEEVLEMQIYRALVVLTPPIFIAVMAWAAGMI